MLLVHLQDGMPQTAVAVAYKIAKRIKEQGGISCPNCGSATYVVRKSDVGQRWMELSVGCIVCPNKFPVPDNILQGIWRNDSEKEVSPLKNTHDLIEDDLALAVG